MTLSSEACKMRMLTALNFMALDIQNLNELCFLSGRGKNKVYSIQWVNIVLKGQKDYSKWR